MGAQGTTQPVLQEPGPVCGSGDVTHSPERFPPWPGRSVSYIKEPGLRFEWSVRLHWNSDYVILPANDQICEPRPPLGKERCPTEAEVHALRQHAKARKMSISSLIYQQPHHGAYWCCRELYSTPSLTKVPEILCLEGTV